MCEGPIKKTGRSTCGCHQTPLVPSRPTTQGRTLLPSSQTARNLASPVEKIEALLLSPTSNRPQVWPPYCAGSAPAHSSGSHDHSNAKQKQWVCHPQLAWHGAGDPSRPTPAHIIRGVASRSPDNAQCLPQKQCSGRPSRWWGRRMYAHLLRELQNYN